MTIPATATAIRSYMDTGMDIVLTIEDGTAVTTVGCGKNRVGALLHSH